MAVSIYSPTSSAGGFPFLHALCLLTCVRWYLIIAFISISLIINGIEHLFTCTLAIGMSLEKCLFRSSGSFFIVFFFFFFLILSLIAVGKFWRLISYGSHGLQMFFPVLWVVFVYGFAMQRLLGLIRSHFKIFCFYFHNSGRVLSLLILMVSLYVHFNFFFPVLMFLSCLSVLARISSTECNRSGGSRQCCLVPRLTEMLSTRPSLPCLVRKKLRFSRCCVFNHFLKNILKCDLSLLIS